MFRAIQSLRPNLLGTILRLDGALGREVPGDDGDSVFDWQPYEENCGGDTFNTKGHVDRGFEKNKPRCESHGLDDCEDHYQHDLFAAKMHSRDRSGLPAPHHLKYDSGPN